MNRAVDREKIRDTILGGRGELLPVTLWHETLPGWDPKWMEQYEEHYGYDPERARELLREAGYEGFETTVVITPQLTALDRTRHSSEKPAPDWIRGRNPLRRSPHTSPAMSDYPSPLPFLDECFGRRSIV